MVEVEGRRRKAEEVVEAAPGQQMAVGILMTSRRFGLGGGLLVDRCRLGCSRSRLTGNVVLRMQLET